jgi:two-component system, NtrC family, sensor kinase
LETIHEKNLPPVHGDEQMLKQVFVNLILNAIDALPPKGLIKISTRKRPEDGYVVIEVNDNGSGIPEHLQSQIFDPFYTTKSKGTGLGLSVSLGIVKRLGGYIKVKSKPGEGTTFTVLLPATFVPSELSSSEK